MKYKEKTKVVAFADDIILEIRADFTRALENYSNVELRKLMPGLKTTISNSTKKSPRLC